MTAWLFEYTFFQVLTVSSYLAGVISSLNTTSPVWNINWTLVTMTTVVSISYAAFSDCSLLFKLWFANQMKQVCLRVGLYAAIISSDFAFAYCPLLALIGCSQAAAPAHCRNIKANTNATKTEQGHHVKSCLTHCVRIHVTQTSAKESIA